MNTVPCRDCAHFEQQHKYRANKRVDAWYGWCKKRSEYPNKEWDAARPFDVDVKRVAQGADRSKPFVVDAKGVIKDCPFVLRVKK